MKMRKVLTCHEKNQWVTPVGPHGSHIFDVDRIVGHKVGHNVYSVGQNKRVFWPS